MENRIFYYKSFLYLFLIKLCFGLATTNAQQVKINATYKKLSTNNLQNEKLIDLYNELSFFFHTVNADSTLYYSSKALQLSNKLNYQKGIADAYKHMAIAHYVRSEGDTAIKLNQLALNMYQKMGELKGQGAVLNNIAIIYHHIGKYDEAIKTHQKALEIRLSINDSFGIAGSYNNIANCLTDKGDYVNSLQNLFEGLYIREKMNDTAAMGNSYANIGGVYYLLKRNDEAYENASKAYKLQKAIGDIEGLVQSLTALGAVCVERNEYQKSIAIFYESLKYASELADLNGIIITNINLGEVYLEINKSDSSLYFYNRALKLALQMGDLPSESVSSNGIGNALIKLGQFNKALPYNLKANQYSVKIGNKLLEFESAKSLGIIYENLNNPIKALYYYKRTLALKDSIYNEENARKTHKIGFDYLLEKKQNEIALLEKDKSIQDAKNERNSLLTFILVFIIVALLVFAFFINKYRLQELNAKKLIMSQKSEIEVQAANLEALHLVKNKTFSILSHDLKNPISSLTSVVELMDEKILSEEDFVNLRVSFRSQLKSLNILLDNTLNWAKSQMTGEIKPNKTMVNIIDLVLQNFELFKQNALQKEITLTQSVDPTLVALVDKNHLDIVIRNIVFNAIKFTKPGGQVSVQTEITPTFLNIKITDNGIGMSKDQINNLFSVAKVKGNFGTGGESGAGIGLLLSHDFIKKNGGELEVFSEENKGTTFVISLPNNVNN